MAQRLERKELLRGRPLLQKDFHDTLRRVAMALG